MGEGPGRSGKVWGVKSELGKVCSCFPSQPLMFSLTTAHVFLHDRSCFPSRPLMFSFTTAHKHKKVYTFSAFGVHLFRITCTPFCRKVYTFFNYRPLDSAFTSARRTIYHRSSGNPLMSACEKLLICAVASHIESVNRTAINAAQTVS